jgi:hypothetical protein
MEMLPSHSSDIDAARGRATPFCGSLGPPRVRRRREPR